ncbi:HAD family hydrolase [Streptomyces sp. NPDC001262]|uniref:HAD family hydrolase n=1 Tax=Streptomyces sp. NPDC001262 TaxID=3364552 RepID=UPI00369A96DA
MNGNLCPDCAGTDVEGFFAAPAAPRLAAVSVDLDDTLYPQEAWLDGALRTVAHEAARRFGLPAQRLYEALAGQAGRGSDRGGIIDRALAGIGADVPVEPLVEAFRSHRVGCLSPYPGVEAALQNVRRAGIPVAVVTDGFPPQQRDKLAALGLDHLFDAIVVSDELGTRELRKPRPEPFLVAARRLGVPPRGMVHVGDRPEKDVAGARAAGLLGAIRVRTGEYRHRPCGEPGFGCFPDAASALVHLTWAARVPRHRP